MQNGDDALSSLILAGRGILVKMLITLNDMLYMYTQKKKFSQYRHCVQYFCKTVLILTNTSLKIKLM